MQLLEIILTQRLYTHFSDIKKEVFLMEMSVNGQYANNPGQPDIYSSIESDLDYLREYYRADTSELMQLIRTTGIHKFSEEAMEAKGKEKKSFGPLEKEILDHFLIIVGERCGKDSIIRINRIMFALGYDYYMDNPDRFRRRKENSRRKTGEKAYVDRESYRESSHNVEPVTNTNPTTSLPDIPTVEDSDQQNGDLSYLLYLSLEFISKRNPGIEDVLYNAYKQSLDELSFNNDLFCESYSS